MNPTLPEKVRLLRELTRGAPDCFAAFVITEREGMERWRPVYSDLRDETLLLHLRGDVEIGTFPLMPDLEWPRCFWVCADFDGKKEETSWREDVQKAAEFLSNFDGCPCFVNLSRSGMGAHVRMLFRESVPAWMARRWMTFWLTEAGILRDESDDDFDDFQEYLPSFDRLIPPQDVLSTNLTFDGHRRPGNLAGAPLNGRHARAHGGTLPLSTAQVARGNFEPDGLHWDHIVTALEQRAWGEAELRESMHEWDISVEPPSHQVDTEGRIVRSLPVIPGDDRELQYTVWFCEFLQHMRRPGTQNYQLWVALATELHRFGEEGREMFHQISSLDSRYTPKDTNLKWEQTKDMRPVRCDTLVQFGYRCPRLNTPGCNGAKAPTFFAEQTDAEIL